jgi:hypothetical protein
MKATKKRVLKLLSTAHCVRLDNRTGYLVWPARGPSPRGTMRCAIGFGTTARTAWKVALETLQNPTQ